MRFEKSTNSTYFHIFTTNDYKSPSFETKGTFLLHTYNISAVDSLNPYYKAFLENICNKNLWN